MPGFLIASPHRYPDLARLWYRRVSRELVPALQNAGFEVEVLIFADGNHDQFPSTWFPEARIKPREPDCRDFVEFYDWTLRSHSGTDRLLFLDADVFFLSGDWLVRRATTLQRDNVAAVSFLPRNRLPGVYALLCRPDVYLALQPPVFAARCERLENWPDSVNRGPGESAALRLRSLGREVQELAADEAERHLADFHGTTVVRVSKELFGGVIGGTRFEKLISEKRYFAMGAYDNILLASLYQEIFNEPFAARDGRALAGSVSLAGLRRALRAIEEPGRQSELHAYFRRSENAIARLARSEGIRLDLPHVVPESWVREADPSEPANLQTRKPANLHP